jgi:hypothetical protein
MTSMVFIVRLSYVKVKGSTVYLTSFPHLNTLEWAPFRSDCNSI